MANIFGTIRVLENAIPYQTKTGFDLVIDGEVRTPIVGKDNEIHGYSVENVAGSIEGAITFSDSLDLRALFDGNGSDVQIEFDGVNLRYVVSDAVFTGPRSMNTDEGEIPVKWNGKVTVLRD